MTTPTIDIAKARADWDAMPHVRTKDEIFSWFFRYAEPLLTALEQMQAQESTLRARVETLELALRNMVYETTHLSPAEDDGSHWCRVSSEVLAQARAALNDTPHADR